MNSPRGLVQVQVRMPGVATLRMEDPAGRNALSGPFLDAFIQALEAIKANAEVRVVVLEGLPDVFCSGADLDTLRSLAAGELKPRDITLPRLVLGLPVPVIAAMEGHAVGGGLAVGLCADMVVLARESRYGCPFMNMGFTPGMGMTRLLEHFMAPSLAQELLYTGTCLPGRAFAGRSSFNAILPRAEVLDHATSLAQAVAEKPVPALKILKNVLSLGRRQAFEASLTLETLMHEITFGQGTTAGTIEAGYVR